MPQPTNICADLTEQNLIDLAVVVELVELYNKAEVSDKHLVEVAIAAYCESHSLVLSGVANCPFIQKDISISGSEFMLPLHNLPFQQNAFIGALEEKHKPEYTRLYIGFACVAALFAAMAVILIFTQMAGHSALNLGFFKLNLDNPIMGKVTVLCSSLFIASLAGDAHSRQKDALKLFEQKLDFQKQTITLAYKVNNPLKNLMKKIPPTQHDEREWEQRIAKYNGKLANDRVEDFAIDQWIRDHYDIEITPPSEEEVEKEMMGGFKRKANETVKGSFAFGHVQPTLIPLQEAIYTYYNTRYDKQLEDLRQDIRNRQVLAM